MNTVANSTVIQFDNLSKTFGRGEKTVRAVRNMNLSISAGQVYGFLGPNGAGKSTTIRMLMDLIRPTSGSVTVFGKNTRANSKALTKVGALVEGANFYNHLNGIENLEVLAKTAGEYSRKRIEYLLSEVGLSDRANRDVGSYSTGMKQRLGIAAAMLNDPELLILDEPTNGLDPAGIQDMRGYFRSLVDNEGKTIFLSSHLLNEVEQICDRVAIIRQGEILREGIVSNLLSEGGGRLKIKASPHEEAKELLDKDWSVSLEENWLFVDAPEEASPKIVKFLVENKINVHQVVAERQSLEDYFMSVTGEDGAVD